MIWRLQAAFRVRAKLKSVAFYASRAKKERDSCGSEMPYWLSVQGSEMTLERLAPGPDSIEGLTPEDLPDSFPMIWLRPIDTLLLQQRGSILISGGIDGAA